MGWLDDLRLKETADTFRCEEGPATCQSVSSQHFQNPSVSVHFCWVHAGLLPLTFYPALVPIFLPDSWFPL